MSILMNNVETESSSQMVILERLVDAMLVLVLIHALMAWFSHRFIVGHDQQRILCLDGNTRWYLIDRQQKPMIEGDLVAFRSDPRMAPDIPVGTLIVKRIEGVPGDAINIGHSHLWIQGIVYELPYPHREQLGLRALPEGTHLIVPDDHFWVMGDHPRSFDSRYIGPISPEQIVGVAHALPF